MFTQLYFAMESKKNEAINTEEPGPGKAVHSSNLGGSCVASLYNKSIKQEQGIVRERQDY